MPAHWPRSGHFALHNSHCNQKGAAHKVLYTLWLQTTTWRNVRVEGPVNEPLSAQSRPDPRRVLCCFWCPNKTWTPPLGASDALKIFKNWLEMRKLPSPPPPPQSKGAQELKKIKPQNTTKPVLEQLKIVCKLLYCY